MRTTLLLLVTLIAAALANGGGNSNSPDVLSEQAVTDFINNYGTDLNALAEFSLGASCGLDTVDSAGLATAAAAFVQKYFSQRIHGYLVVQATQGFAPFTVLNATVGGAAQPALGIPALPNSEALYAYLQSAYAGFFNFAFSRPFWWTIDKVLVDQIKVRDFNYGGSTTAYVRASDINEGFHCNNIGTPNLTRTYLKQQSVYHHVLVLEDAEANTPGYTGHGPSAGLVWRYINFEETNKNTVAFDPLPLQVQPVN